MQSLPCPLNCGATGLRPSDLVNHVRNECPHRTSPCHACGAVLKHKDLERHMREKCPSQHRSSPWQEPRTSWNDAPEPYNFGASQPMPAQFPQPQYPSRGSPPSSRPLSFRENQASSRPLSFRESATDRSYPSAASDFQPDPRTDYHRPPLHSTRSDYGRDSPFTSQRPEHAHHRPVSQRSQADVGRPPSDYIRQPADFGGRGPPPSTRTDYTHGTSGYQRDSPSSPWSQAPHLQPPSRPSVHQDGFANQDGTYSAVPSHRTSPGRGIGAGELHAEVAHLRTELQAQHEYSEKLATELMVLRADICGVQQANSVAATAPAAVFDSSLEMPSIDTTETERRIQDYVNNIFSPAGEPPEPSKHKSSSKPSRDSKSPKASKSASKRSSIDDVASVRSGRSRSSLARERPDKTEKSAKKASKSEKASKKASKSRSHSRTNSVVSGGSTEYLDDDEEFKFGSYQDDDELSISGGSSKKKSSRRVSKSASLIDEDELVLGTDDEDEGLAVSEGNKMSANEEAVAELMKSMGGGAALLAASDSDDSL